MTSDNVDLRYWDDICHVREQFAKLSKYISYTLEFIDYANVYLEIIYFYLFSLFNINLFLFIQFIPHKLIFYLFNINLFLFVTPYMNTPLFSQSPTSLDLFSPFSFSLSPNPFVPANNFNSI